MSMESVLVIGAGQAGMQLAVTLRDEGYSGKLTLVGSEERGPYQRPPLSKTYLAGIADEHSLSLRTDRFYEDNQIELITGEEIVEVSFAEDSGSARSGSGMEFNFDKLAITTGAKSRVLEVPGSSLNGVFTLRSLSDADKIKLQWGEIKNLVIVGAGFIGLEAAAVATAAGKKVVVLHSGDRLMSRSVTAEVSDFYLSAHRRRGTDFIFRAEVRRFVGDSGNVTGVELASGEILPADAVIVGIGVARDNEAFSNLGLITDGDAIVVDQFAQTSHKSVVAAGDAVALTHPAQSGQYIRLESVQNAVDQATVAAHTLLGNRRPYNLVPRFWSDQSDLKLQIAGLFQGHDQAVVRGDIESEQFSVLYYRDEILIAVHSVNDASSQMAGRKALAHQVNIPADAAANLSIPLKTLIETNEG